MWEFLFAIGAIVVLAAINLPGKVYDITAKRYDKAHKENVEAWKKRVTIDSDEENDLMRDIMSHMANYYDDFQSVIDSIKATNPTYTGSYGHETSNGGLTSIENGIKRVVLAKRGKMPLADSLFGIVGDSTDAPFVKWVDRQLKEHGINEKLYFTYRSEIHPMDNIPKRTIGEYMWDPQINGMYKRP